MNTLSTVGAVATFVTLLLSSVAAGSVFLDKQGANTVIARQKRANAGNEEATMPANLERECLEEVCNYEEAHEIFQDYYRTDIFWTVYIDGDQCAERPCKNGAMCSDSVGGYDCVCKSGFSGVHCETDQAGCVLDKTKGCSQFCKPGYQSYECSCAHGWKLQSNNMDKCVPAVTFPCGKVSSLSRWESRQSTISREDHEGLTCNAEECPWQALLRSTESPGFCSGVILKENLVLTTAQCANKYNDFQVVVGKRTTSSEDGEQILYMKLVHVHPRYVPGRPDNDLAVVELRDRIMFKKSVVAACLPERDFADSVLLAGELPVVATGWKDAPGDAELQGHLTLNYLGVERLADCVDRHPGLVTNKMGCAGPRAKADCVLSPGSPLLTLYRDVFFLTGVLSRPEGYDCQRGYVFQKVSRYLPWLQPLLSTR